MADIPGRLYDSNTLQGAYAREKTVRSTQGEQGIFSISSNRGASGHSNTSSSTMRTRSHRGCWECVFAIQLMYSGNFEAFVQKNQLNEVRVAIGINTENFSWKLAPGILLETRSFLVTHTSGIFWY